MFVAVLLGILFFSGELLTSGLAEVECPSVPPGEVVYIPSPTNCAVFYECVDGVRYEGKCPDGTWWHPAVEQCDYPGDFCDAYNSRTQTPSSTTTSPKTTTRTTTTTTTTTTTRLTTTTTVPPTTTTTVTTTLSPEQRCKTELEVSYWPHPQHCHLFIECYEGDAYEMACPTGLYFSESQKRCVNANEAECCASSTVC